MTTSIILHVGNDICHRIPIMRAASFAVFQSEVSVPAIRKAFAGGGTFSAITFHADISAPSLSVVWAARKLSAAPVVLFDNPSINHDRSCFDVVIPNLTYPSRWLKKLHDAIEATRQSSRVAFSDSLAPTFVLSCVPILSVLSPHPEL